jgi:hypothetical protein
VQENELNVHGAAKVALIMSDESIAFLAFKARDLFIQAAARSRETPPRKERKPVRKSVR